MSPANIDSYVGRRPAWHKLGIVTGAWLTWSEIEEKANLGWEPEKEPLFDAAGMPVKAWGIFRSDDHRFLGSVGEKYQPIHHRVGFKLIDSVLSDCDGAHYETAGSLGNGEVVWGLADLDVATRIKGTDDRTEHYLLFSTSHDASRVFELRTTSVRVVCENTLGMALDRKAQNAFRIRHTSQYEARVKAAQTILESFKGQVTDIETRLNALAQRRVNKTTLTAFIDKLFPADAEGNRSSKLENTITALLERFESNDGNAIPQIRGTAYNLLNATTEWVDHYRGTRRTKGQDETTSRLVSATFGEGDRIKRAAFSTLLALSDDMPSHSIAQPVIHVPTAAPFN